MLEVKGVNQSYNKNSAKKTLEDITLTVRENKITALVGSNGAGKSTLLGVMSNLIPALSGEVLLDGKNIAQMKSSDIAKRIAVLRQTNNLTIRIKINDLVEFGRYPHCGGRLKSEDFEAVEKALEYMDLIDLRGKYLDEISGGQRQRAFIAMILAQDTHYIFLDEPLNNLDIKYSVEMMKIINRLVNELGKTVVIVLHDINFAAAYADHIITMKNGRIIAEGSPKTMVTKDVMDDIFEFDFNIADHNGKKVCLYFD